MIWLPCYASDTFAGSLHPAITVPGTQWTHSHPRTFAQPLPPPEILFQIPTGWTPFLLACAQECHHLREASWRPHLSSLWTGFTSQVVFLTPSPAPRECELHALLLASLGSLGQRRDNSTPSSPNHAPCTPGEGGAHPGHRAAREGVRATSWGRGSWPVRLHLPRGPGCAWVLASGPTADLPPVNDFKAAPFVSTASRSLAGVGCRLRALLGDLSSGKGVVTQIIQNS